MNPLPNFLIIGAQKSGTTSLYYALKQHNEIFMPETKEINFFFKENLYKKGIDYYRTFFKNASGYKAIGEASPGYICNLKSPEWITNTLNSVKLILILRDPRDRAYSQYYDNKNNLSEFDEFEFLVDTMLSHTPYSPGMKGYFSRGLYSIYIQNYLRYFNLSDFLILEFDDLIHEFDATISKCLSFLNLDSNFHPKLKVDKKNRSSIYNNKLYNILSGSSQITRHIPFSVRKLALRGQKKNYIYPPMDMNVKTRLTDFYRAHNIELSKITGLNFEKWNTI